MDTQPPTPLAAALRAAVEVGIAPVDAARIAGVPIPTHYSDQEARAGAFFVRWFRQGELTGVDADGRRLYGEAGWHVSSATWEPRTVPDEVRRALRELISVARPYAG